MLKDIFMAGLALIFSLLLVPLVQNLQLKSVRWTSRMHVKYIPELCRVWAGWQFTSAFLRCCF